MTQIKIENSFYALPIKFRLTSSHNCYGKELSIYAVRDNLVTFVKSLTYSGFIEFHRYTYKFDDLPNERIPTQMLFTWNSIFATQIWINLSKLCNRIWTHQSNTHIYIYHLIRPSSMAQKLILFFSASYRYRRLWPVTTICPKRTYYFLFHPEMWI